MVEPEADAAGLVAGEAVVEVVGHDLQPLLVRPVRLGLQRLPVPPRNPAFPISAAVVGAVGLVVAAVAVCGPINRPPPGRPRPGLSQIVLPLSLKLSRPAVV